MENTLSSEWRENIESLKRYIGELQGKHKEIVEQSKELDEKLQGMEDEIASLLIVYQKALQNKKQEIESLRSQHTEVQKPTKGSTKFQRVYTDEQRQQMIAIYKACHYKRKVTWEQVKAQMGINISETSLVRILQEERVFKRTYRKRKKYSKKK